MIDYLNPSHLPFANSCVSCGAEMPEGDQVCTRCRERTAFNRNASQTIDDRIRELEAEIRMLRGVKKAMGGRDDYIDRQTAALLAEARELDAAGGG